MNGCIPICKHCGNFIWCVPAWERGFFGQKRICLACSVEIFALAEGLGGEKQMVLDKSHGEMWSQLSVNTTHAPPAAPSPAVPHLTLLCHSPTGSPTHPSSSCTAPSIPAARYAQYLHTDLPKWRAALPMAESLLSARGAGCGRSLTACVNQQGECNGMSLSFEFHLKGQVDSWGRH